MQETKTTVEQTVPHELAGLRLDQVLPLLFVGHSRAELQRLIQNGDVKLNTCLPKKRHIVSFGDVIAVTFSPRPQDHIIPQKMHFDILFEDECMFVINKPPGLVVHPAPGNWQGTFVHGFLAHCAISDCGSSIRPGIVHRLDKETSGVLVAAKSTPALHALCQQFHDRLVEKEYAAIVTGFLQGEFDVRGTIGRDPKNRLKMTLREGGKDSFTHFVSLKSNPDFSLIKAFPHTGRTHQIRVHLSSLGFPIVGDILYGQKEGGTKRVGASRQLLHCERITLRHPLSHAMLTLYAPLPDDMRDVIKRAELMYLP